jgi:hypothetical protein
MQVVQGVLVCCEVINDLEGEVMIWCLGCTNKMADEHKSASMPQGPAFVLAPFGLLAFAKP